MNSAETREFLSGLDEATLEALTRAERLVDDMSVSFREEALRQTRRLGDAIASQSGHYDGNGDGNADGDEPARCRDAFEASHELRGQAGTFGYSLLTEICDSLCAVLELFIARGGAKAGRTALDRKMWAAIRNHAEAVATVVEHDLKGDGGEIGRQLTAELGRLRTHFSTAAV